MWARLSKLWIFWIFVFAAAIAAQDEAKPRHAPRYRFEMVYALNERLTQKNLQRAEEMFFKAWPKYSPKKNNGRDALNSRAGEDRKYWALYRPRLLKAEGIDTDALREKVTRQIGTAGGAAVSKRRIDMALDTRCLKLCSDRINRELRLRRILRFINFDAFSHPGRSLSVVFKKLAADDSKNEPLCSMTPGKGLIVFRVFDKALSSEQIMKLRDGTVEFGWNLQFRVGQAARTKLPAVSQTAKPLGNQGDGRMILRVFALDRKPAD